MSTGTLLPGSRCAGWWARSSAGLLGRCAYVSSCVGGLSLLPASGPDLPGAADDKLGRGESFGPHRTVGVELGGGDADLGAEAELASVGKARRRVDHDGRRVDLGDEPFGGGAIGGHDRLG